MKYAVETTARFAKGLSLIEIMIAIGILAVSMMLIAAAFPAGVAMSIAVSDETTSQAVFEEAVSVIRDNYSRSKIENDFGSGELPDSSDYILIKNIYLGRDSAGNYDLVASPPIGLANRSYEVIAGQSSIFSWSALIKRMQTTGPMGNLCQVIIIVSRKPSGNPDFLNEDRVVTPVIKIPEIRSVPCVNSVPTARTIEVESGPDSSEPANQEYFARMPNTGYIIDSDTGTAYSIISRNDNNTVTLLTTPPDISSNRDFWVIPGPYDGSNYGRSSPAVRVFAAMLYLP